MRILVVDDMQDTTDSLVRSLQKAGHDAIPAYSEKTAFKLLKENTFDIIVTDMLMENPDSGLLVLREAKRLDPRVEVILLTGYAEVKTAIPAMHLGAFDYVRKSPENQDIYDIVVDKVDRASLIKQLCDAFEADEIAVLCLFLGFDYDELPRESKRDKMVHMFNELSQNDELHLLEALLGEIRPDLLGTDAREKDPAAIMYRIVERALERNPDIISEVYSGILNESEKQNRPKARELCQAVLSKSFNRDEHDESIVPYDQPDPPVTYAPTVAFDHNVYDEDKSQDALAPTRHAFLKVDVVEHSRIVKHYKTALVNETFDNFESLVCKEVTVREGEIWSWLGDGGLCVFSDMDCEDRATLSAAAILTGMQVFNIEQNSLPVVLDVCIAIHTGYVTVKGDKGSIHSEVINFVSNLEDSAVEKNSICISSDVFRELSEQIKKCFSPNGLFEGKEIYVYDG